MANEITLSASLTCTKNGVSVSGNFPLTKTMEGNAMLSNTQAVGTSAEALVVGDVTSPAQYLLIKNLDATNFVQLALDSGVSTQIFAKLLAGGVCLLPPATNTVYAKSDTASCNIQVVAVST